MPGTTLWWATTPLSRAPRPAPRPTACSAAPETTAWSVTAGATPPPGVRTTISRAATATTASSGTPWDSSAPRGPATTYSWRGPGSWVTRRATASPSRGTRVGPAVTTSSTSARTAARSRSGTTPLPGAPRSAPATTGSREEARGSSSSSATVPWGDATGATAGRDVIYGRGGNDLLFGDNIDQNTRSVPGVGAIDSIDGGAGDDILRGGPNADFLNGNTGRDDCDGEQGTDVEINCEI
ncbi:hypothetical protein [Streptomyces mirabilis]|uniref:hypothetical protein n=1 Tax=Streptomyces mirabilis TaxID=68239 RepID=UPI0036B73F8F